MAPLTPYQRRYKAGPVLAGDKNVGSNTTAPHTNSQAHVGVLALHVECTRQEWSCGGCLQFKARGGQCTSSGRTTKTQGIYVTCGRSSCIGDSPSALAQSARRHCHTKEDGYNARRCGGRGDGHAGALRSPAPPSARDPLDNQPRASVPSFN